MVLGKDENKATEALADIFGKDLNGLKGIIAAAAVSEGFKILGPVLNELNFVVNVDIEGEYKKEGFEPKVKAEIKIGRDIDKVIELKKLEFDIEQIKMKTQLDMYDRMEKQRLSQRDMEKTPIDVNDGSANFPDHNKKD